MKKRISVTVNGLVYEREIVASKTLLEFLREDLELTGTKKGCNNGDCGSCTVLLNGKPILSCLFLAVEADGHTVLTIEGMSKGSKLHPIQEAFIDAGAIQCGYCTPGMVLAAKALLDEKGNPAEREIKEAISGHLCRCTGYAHIVTAIKNAAEYVHKQGKEGHGSCQT